MSYSIVLQQKGMLPILTLKRLAPQYVSPNIKNKINLTSQKQYKAFSKVNTK